MIHPGLIALEKWEPVEYASGYRARLAGIPDSEEAHHCWRCGWEDADTEALESDRNKRALAEGGEDDYQNTWDCCSIPEEMPEQMVFRSMVAGHSHGERDGSQPISI